MSAETERGGHEPGTDAMERLVAALSASGQAAYEWIVADGVIRWSGRPVPALEAMLREPNILHRRCAAILAPSAGEPHFAIAYPARFDGHGVMIEESGLREFNALGQVSRVIGIVRHSPETAAPVNATWMLSRDDLVDVLNKACADPARETGPGAYVVIGIDDLPMFNDTYGFQATNDLIHEVGRMLMDQARPCDTIGRLSGTKFGMVMGQCGAGDTVGGIRRTLSAIQERMFRTRAGELRATVCAGCVLLPSGADSGGEIITAGADSLRRARAAGRGSYHVYRPDHQQIHDRRARSAMAAKVLSALKDDRITVAYQPIIDARSGDIDRWECLVRIREADGDIVPAAAFIGVAEQLGVVHALDQRVLSKALAVLQAHPRLRLAINVSSQVATQGTWIATFLETMAEARSVAGRLCVELTEVSAIRDLDQAGRFVAGLRDLGCQIAIDDFGAGYTSFRNLQRLEIDSVKIDGSFIKGVADDPSNQFFVRTLVDLARHFDLSTTAEFVGRESDAALLRDMGVDEFQGYLIGMPVMEPEWMRGPNGETV